MRPIGTATIAPLAPAAAEQHAAAMTLARRTIPKWKPEMTRKKKKIKIGFVKSYLG
jgi:hypothetical protein